MDVPWTRITPFDFERLALEYAQSEYPQLKWVPTPRSGDGNRDAEAVTREWVLDRLIEYQHWLEAKFHHKKGAPARSQLDPTLVSGLIDPSVRAILFVTNGRISDSYMARAERAFSRPPDRFVAFREGPHLAHWLSRHKAIALRYFGAGIDAIAAAQPPPLELSSASLLDISDYRRAFYKPISHLVAGRDYLLHLVTRSTQTRDLDLLLPELSPFIASGPPKNRRIHIPAGTSSHCIRVTPRQVGVFNESPVGLGESGVSAAGLTLKRLTVKGDPGLQIAFAAQAKVASDLKQLMRSLRKGSNAICCLYGKAGVGKTHVLDSLEADLDLHADFLRIAFSGQQGEDARLICEMLLFLHFGPAGLNLGAIDHSLIASSRQVRFFGRRLLNGLKRAIADASEARALVRDLVEDRDVRSAGSPLIDPQPAATSVVVVADDVHKLRSPEAGLLTRILTDHFNGSHNSLLLLSARSEEFRTPALKTSIDQSAIYLTELHPPMAQEVAESLDQLLGHPCPKGFSVALNSTVYTTLNVVNLLVDLMTKGERVSEPDLIQTLDQWARTLSVGKDKVVLERIAKSSKLFPLLDVVYAVRIGVSLPPLLEKFGARAVNTAAERTLLRLSTDGLAVPFHDLVYDAYIETRSTCYTHEAGAFIARCLEQGTLAPDRALPALLRCGPSFESRYLDAALGYRDSFINIGRFGPALEVAKSIVTVFESRQGQQLPDDEKALAEAWFVYADCLNQCDTGDDTRRYFELAKGDLSSKWSEPLGSGIHFEAEAELFNLRFWDLEVQQIPALEDFASRLERAMKEEPKILQERRFVRAYLTALNRLMTFSLLTDRPTEELLKRNLLAADDLRMTNYHGFALVDYAKGTYHTDAKQSLLKLREGNELFRRLGSERRRELTSATELAFLECRLGDGSVAAVSAAGRALLDEGLWPEYLNSRLKIVALLLAHQDGEGASGQLIEFYRRRSTASDDTRRAFLLANMEAGAAFLKGDYGTAHDWTMEHRKLVRELGVSYRDIAEWNLVACERRTRQAKRIGWYQSGVKQPASRFLLEPRIW